MLRARSAKVDTGFAIRSCGNKNLERAFDSVEGDNALGAAVKLGFFLGDGKKIGENAKLRVDGDGA